MNSPNLAECNYSTMKGRHFEVAVLPFGATEPHNLHLPYGNDTLTVTAMAQSACRKANEQGASALLLPSMPYGVDSNVMAFPFTMNCRPSTHLAFMQDLVDSLEHHGIHKLVIANGHGGNEFGFILREMFGATSVFLSVYEWWKAVEDNLPPDCRPTGDHADHMETSLSLYLFPHLVDMRVADDGATKTCRLEAVRKGYVKITRPWHLVTRNAGVGDPRQATAEKGEKIFNLAVEQLTAYMVELSAAEMDETFPY